MLMKKIPTAIPGAMLLAAGLLLGNVSYADDCADFDYGDAPDNGVATGTGSYNTLATRNGAWHNTCGLVWLGIEPGDGVLPANGGQEGTLQNAQATADDTNNFADEDGVPLSQRPTITTTSTSTKMQVTASNIGAAPALLACWIDFNRNGQFGDLANELATTTVAAASGTQTYTLTFAGFSAPATAGETYLRCRISTAWTSAAQATPVGPPGVAGTATSIDGEVEDYLVPILPPCVTSAVIPVPATPPLLNGVKFTISAGAGLSNIASITCQKTTNINVATGMTFSPTQDTGPTGTPPSWTFSPAAAAVAVTARKAGTGSATIACTAADSSGNVCSTDPVIEEVLRVKGQAVTLQANNGEPLTPNFRYMQIKNGSPGLTNLEVNVNGTKLKESGLKDGESRDVANFARAMDRDANYISLTGKGKPGATASVFISDEPLQ